MWMRIGKKEEEEECSFVFALCCFMCNTDVCSLSLSLSLSSTRSNKANNKANKKGGRARDAYDTARDYDMI